VYFLTTANRDKEWAWKLLQYLGGKTKDGAYTQAVNLAKDAMLGSGYSSVMNSDVIKTGWRHGDAAPMSVVELVDRPQQQQE